MIEDSGFIEVTYRKLEIEPFLVIKEDKTSVTSVTSVISHGHLYFLVSNILKGENHYADAFLPLFLPLSHTHCPFSSFR